MNGVPSIGATRPAPLPSPRQTLQAAKAVLERPGAIAGSGWARSVALLARQALEDAVTVYWARAGVPGMANATGKSRFVALRYYLDIPTLARQAHHTWSALSDATHHHGYDLAPTASELRAWLDTVDRTIEGLATAATGPAPTPGRRHTEDG